MKVQDVLALLKEETLAEMRILAEETLGLSRTQMMVYPEREILSEQQKLLDERIQQLKAGRPIQYILGKWEFMGHTFLVGDGVLIPREDTAAATELAGEFLKQKKDALFADLGSGSGCIAVTLALEHDVQGFAVERSAQAFCYLKKNIVQAGGKVFPVLGDMFSREVLERLPQLDLIISNPPYITSKEMQQLDRNVRYEPHEALFGGEDGLYYYHRITEVYRNKLKDGGLLVFEVGFQQADAVLEILKNAGFHSPCEKKDFNGIRRAVGAMK